MSLGDPDSVKAAPRLLRLVPKGFKSVASSSLINSWSHTLSSLPSDKHIVCSQPSQKLAWPCPASFCECCHFSPSWLGVHEITYHLLDPIASCEYSFTNLGSLSCDQHSPFSAEGFWLHTTFTCSSTTSSVPDLMTRRLLCFQLLC